MGRWIKHTEDTFIASYLKETLSAYCDYCGHEMENYYNDDLRCTNRRCSNPLCEGMMAAKGEFMFKLLGYRGIGFATCRKMISEHGLKHHVRLLKVAGPLPTMPLYEYLRIHCFPGVDSEWEKTCKVLSIYTLDELYEKYDGKFKQLLIDNKELLYSNLDCVELEKRPEGLVSNTPTKYLNVMITGTPNGFNSKEHFINTVNQALQGKIVILHQATKRITGVDYLIREQGSVTRGKLEAAIKGGIPVVTSQQFLLIIRDMLKQ